MTTASTVKTKDKPVHSQSESASWHEDMESVDISEVKDVLGRHLGKLHKKPVAIMKGKQAQAVVISAKEYAILKEISELQEDAYWAEQADEVVANEKPIGVKASEKLLNEMLNA